MSSFTPPDKNHSSEPQPERKIPEFIYVDHGPHENVENIGSTPHQDPKQVFGSIQTMAKGKHPFYLRVLALIGSLIMVFGCVLVLLITLVFVCMSLILLRQSAHMNEQASIAWKVFKKAIVFTLGGFVCIFNLSFGLGIIMMYFMLTGEAINSRFMQEFNKRRQ